ncbi:hypothetical protein TELCIR_13601, partial [Teladorsagia circumcincta]
MDKVDEFFGSTHPGAYDDKQKICVKSWRGLSFCFPTAESANVEVTPGFGPLRSLKFDSATQPRLTKMSIFKGTAVGKNEWQRHLAHQRRVGVGQDYANNIFWRFSGGRAAVSVLFVGELETFFRLNGVGWSAILG